jgi:hypothetical protein
MLSSGEKTEAAMWRRELKVFPVAPRIFRSADERVRGRGDLMRLITDYTLGLTIVLSHLVLIGLDNMSSFPTSYAETSS